jgi:glycosyltransferase involved in cell wall biosynthesis
MTVVVPCHDYGTYLGQCVNSVIDRPGVDLEVLVIDDASTDDTPTIGAALAATDSRITFTRHDERLGHVATYNEGLARATGDYALVLSADDAVVPGALGRAARFLDDEPTVGLVYGRTVFFEHGALPLARHGGGHRRVRAGNDWIAARCRAGTNCISSPEAVVRTSLLRRIGAYRDELPMTGDLELWLRCAAHADVGYLRGTDQAYYRRHANSMFRARLADPLIDLCHRRAAFELFFTYQRLFVVDADVLEDDYRRALAREALHKASRAYDHDRVSDRTVARLVEFAESTYEAAQSLPEAAGLRLRRRLGPRVSRWMPPLAGVAAAGRVRDVVTTWRWSRTGDL